MKISRRWQVKAEAAFFAEGILWAKGLKARDSRTWEKLKFTVAEFSV